MFRPTGFASLAARRVGIFGYGIEGRATQARVQSIAASVVIVDDAPDVAPGVIVNGEGGHEALLTCDVVFKSPGIPRHRADVLDLEAHGVAVCSALNLWFHDADRDRVVAITGTKGKSTTTALVTYFLECLGEAAQRLGNIGRPPYDPAVDTSSGWLVLEVSSFQCVDLDMAPALIVVTSLGDDHIDWHGSTEKYRDDKLSLTRHEGAHRTLVPDNATFHEVRHQLGGEVTFVAPEETHLASALGLLGAHSDSNVALALAAVSALTTRPVEEIRALVLENSASFVPLSGRLTLVAIDKVGPHTLRFVDDGLATSVLPAVAALEVFTPEPVALIAGGYDRGVDYQALARAIASRTQPTMLLTMGDAGARIAELVHQLSPQLVQSTFSSMDEALVKARGFLSGGGVILLSPGAPSFDRYKNWEERSHDFTRAVRARPLGD
ncbi:MAG: UDP-N-acetylmuramoyl-L-alanine--D-glutamate ligase [Acidimicrobiales bacterium]